MTPLVPAALAVVAVLLWPGRAGSRPAMPRPASRTGSGGRLGGSRALSGAPTTTDDVADALVLLALALRTGMGQQEALELVSRLAAHGAGRHLASVAAALRWGRDGAEAWSYAPPVWRPAATAWRAAAAAGCGPAALVEQAAGRLRDEEERRLEAAAARAGVLLVLPLGLAFLPAFLCTAVVPVVLALAHDVLRP